MNLNELNAFYSRLQTKCVEILTGMKHRAFECQWAWYNGHYYKNEAGEYAEALYPIPVISVKGLCDIEINPDCVTLTAKRSRTDTLDYSFAKFDGVYFEVFSVEHYLDDYYAPGITMKDFRERIRKSQEKELGFSFRFSFDVDGDRMYEFVKLLRREGFYY